MGLNYVAIAIDIYDGSLMSMRTVGMARFRDGEVVASDSFPVAGISGQDTNGEAQSSKAALARIRDFVQNDLVVAHDGTRVASSIEVAADMAGLVHPKMPYFCTLDLVKQAVPSLSDYALASVAGAMRINKDIGNHDVVQQAITTGLICVRLAAHSDTPSLADLMKGYRVSIRDIDSGKESTVVQPLSVRPSNDTQSTPNVPTLTRRERREMEQRQNGTSTAVEPIKDWEELTATSSVTTPTADRSSDAVPSRESQPESAYTSSQTQASASDQSAPNPVASLPTAEASSRLPLASVGGAEITVHRNSRWKVFLVPILPFFLVVVFGVAKLNALAGLFLMIWIISIPAATIYFFVKRSSDRKVSPQNIASSYKYQEAQNAPTNVSAVDLSPVVSPMVTIAEVPVAPSQQQNINILNARRIANESIAYAQSLERALSQTTQRANSMQEVFDRHDMADMVALENTRQNLKADIKDLGLKKKATRAEIREAQAVLNDIKLDVMYDEVGLIDYDHIAESSVLLANKLASVRSSIKAMVRDKTAYTYLANFTFNNSATKGKQFSERMAKTMLSAYNAESENAIRSLRSADNSTAAKNKINKSRERVTKNGEMVGLKITDGYHNLRLQEVDLAAQHLLAVRIEKELEKERREELREQEKAAKELQAEHDRLEKERQHYLNTLRAVTANGDEEAILRMQEKLDEIEDAIENVDSRAANTRAGHVYIISNVGAFGEGIVKIGMTRRLEPMDRVKELGDASVPFRFDTHALFFAEDAVGVENTLHKHFASQRVNRVNLRREFFYTTPGAVLEALKEHNVELVEFTEDFEAEEYRVSQEIMEQERAA